MKMKSRNWQAPAFCAGALLMLAGSLPAFDLVKNGKTAEIVLPEKPHPSTKLAAQELTEYTEKVTGKKLTTVTGKSSAANRIYIGTLDTVKDIPADIVQKLNAQKSKESAVIQAKGNVLYIIGKFEVADMYAACHFIENKLGVRWLKPANEFDSGEYVPKKSEVSFADYTEVRTPWAFHRALDQCGTGGTISRLTKTWANRNGMQTPIVWGGKINYAPKTLREKEIYEFYAPRIPHYLQQLSPDNHATFYGPLRPRKKTFEEHPEYFALVDGKRKMGDQICIGNPEVQKKVAESIISRLDKEQGNGMFTFGMVDYATGWCECDQCKALDKNDPHASFRDVSTRFFNAVNPIARTIWEKYPEADLRTWAYSAYRRIPYKTVLDPRLKVQFAMHGRLLGS